MGLLKLGSIYKKKSKKDSVTEQPAVPIIAPSKLEPLTLELNLDLANAANTPPKPLEKDNTPTAAGGLFDDIFSGLDNSEPKLNKVDSLHTDFSLALALSEQLQVDDTKPVMKSLPKEEKKTAAEPTNNFLLGGDSIYSSYLRAMDSSNDNTFASSSMFDSLINKSTTTNCKSSAQTPTSAPAVAPAPPTTQVVLDSDVSDSDEGSKNSEDSDEGELFGQQQRMTKGVQPIMGRRAQDNRLLVQRKIDNWTKQVDPEAKIVETNAAMISRMKDRHRNQVKMAAMRQQQLPEYNNNLMGHPHMVPQAYGMPLGQNNMVLPHPSMYMDPAHAPVYFQSTDYSSTDMPQQYNNASMSTGPTASIRASFIPNPSHSTSAHNRQDNMEAVKQPQLVMAKSMSTPTMRHHRKIKEMPNQSQSSVQSSVAPSSISSSAQVNELPNSSGTDVEPAEDKEPAASDLSLPISDNPSSVEDDLAAQEADAESSDDEESRSVKARKQKSLKKSRQKAADTESVGATAAGEEGGARANYRQVRSSRSAPNLKKKPTSKKSSHKSSNSSSRRNSQDYATITSTPTSEVVKTPPPLPTVPVLNEEDQQNGLRSNTYPVPAQYQQQPIQRGPVKHMRSDPDLHKRNTQYQYQQQHLTQEWERMQIHQREQQLKNHYQNKFAQQPVSSQIPVQQQQQQQQQQQGSYMAMYSPMYYPNIPGRMAPYSSNGSSDNNAGHYTHQDPRASFMCANGQMAFQQPVYYHPPPR
ncbi:hypothetical protein BD560DRAFT_434293 [Blakeslea trispora]|nr:hypothetical protein BD560DRAFT_434293 [Blakeslea trispora]